MSKNGTLIFGFGILCLVCGLLLAYFGYFAPPYLFLTSNVAMPAESFFAPLLLIFLGGFIVFAGIISKFTSKKRKGAKKAQPQLPPPPPPPAEAA